MGYGSWSLHFSPVVIARVVDLTSTWTHEIGTLERYEAALRLVMGPSIHDRSQRVFPD